MSQVADIFLKLASVPSVPLGEFRMMRLVDEILSGIKGVEVETDRFGNRIARLRRDHEEASPVTFVAHLDHPGFLFEDPTPNRGGLLHGRFEGRVRDEYFPGSSICIYTHESLEAEKAVILEASGNRPDTDDRAITVEVAGPIEVPAIGVWDVPPAKLENGILSGLACDDLAGCAAMLTALKRLSMGFEPVDITLIFTRAEEAGFCGLLALLAEEEAPSLINFDGDFISVEISGETPSVQLGGGAIVRVGDQASTFHPHVVNRCHLAALDGAINASRALMDRGTCEATPMIRAGLSVGGVCIPVRNYHNMNQETGRIDSEKVSLADLEALVDLIHAISLYRSDPQKSVAHGKSLDFELFLRKGRTGLTDPTKQEPPIRMGN
ncbi:MAG: M20/M25/M40 family metallo-hydrolase [Candidatus Sumerlaeia bacterium]|nr:M20/M25/M40 family metallo-hydrolase [Candidatus Sumerlaeia bacterium]